MGVGITGDEGEAVIVAGIQGGLQAVVVGFVDVRHLVNKGEVGELRVVGAARLLAVAAGNLGRRVGVHLVDIANAGQLGAMIADIGNFQRQVVVEGMLNVQGPVFHVRRAQMRVHPQNGARVGGAVDGAGGEHRSIPVERGAGESDIADSNIAAAGGNADASGGNAA